VHTEESGLRILVVDDDQGIRESLQAILDEAYSLAFAVNGAMALDIIDGNDFDLVLLDLSLPKVGGLEVLKAIKREHSDIDVIIVSATDKAKEAISAMQAGAYGYITKPFEPDEILSTVTRVFEKRALEQEVQFLRSEVSERFPDKKIISCSKAMDHVLHMVEKVASASSSVLITGESGTGKELVARAIHMGSPRERKPFVAINCAAIPSELIESELFGHEKGAFTGANTRTIGKFEYANHGTIFLDEISSLRLDLQAQLLRFLQERELTRVGSHRAIKVDVRLLAATNRRLEEMVQDGSFREDLFFRLNVIPLDIPPLRKREGDISLLAENFIRKFNLQLNKEIKGISPEAMAVLELYPWPGNVRELENFIERMVVLSPQGCTIGEKDLPFEFFIPEKIGMEEETGGLSDAGLVQARRAFERKFILRILQQSNWNQTEAAKALQVHRNTLLNKMKELEIKDSS
jgi:DNA-binding NtrC family response regulator